MYVLTGRRRAEFLACPELVRMGERTDPPILMLKTTTLSAKYLLRSTKLRVAILRVRGYILYGLLFEDGYLEEAMRWSLCEAQSELEGLQTLCSLGRMRLTVFNEAAVCIAIGDCILGNAAASLLALCQDVTPYPFRPDGVDSSTMDEADSRLRQLMDGKLSADEGIFVDVLPPATWTQVKNHFIGNNAASELVSLFDSDEGGQQETLAYWLLDELSPEGAIRSPMVDERGNVRELTDILLTHRYGNILFESKALSLLSRPTLPLRDRLAQQTVSHIRKAARQLAGAARNIAAGLCIMDREGNIIKVDRTQPPHLVILIPELSLIESREEVGIPFFHEVMQNTRGFLHILDPSELLRIVQAGSMIAARGQTITPMMAFDNWLMRRAERLVEVGHPYFQVLLRFDEDQAEEQSESHDSNGH
jgi:hypothetical protein